jgi:HPt (histidine-containing phosphotransfer) domain-containing protein
MNETTTVTDLSFLKTFTGDDNERIVKYINNFLGMGPEKVKAMEAALAEKNYQELRGAAHKLKPQLSYMGINSIKDDIQNIEDFADEGKNLDQLPALVSKVTAVCRQAFSELDAFVKSA